MLEVALMVAIEGIESINHSISTSIFLSLLLDQLLPLLLNSGCVTPDIN